jgi:hypothetical protein
MSLNYGFVKCKVVSDPILKSSRHKQEIQYHLHSTLSVPGPDGTPQNWDSAVNVGTNDADDLLRYRLAYDYHHPILTTLKAAAAGFSDLTGTAVLPALDFMRSDILAETGKRRGRLHLRPYLYRRRFGNPRRAHEPGIFRQFLE